MTEPTGGTPPPPEPPSVQAPPPAAAPAAAPPEVPPAPAAWQTPAPVVVAGPAPGVAYAGLGIRIGAYIIDAILLSIVYAFVFVALGAILPRHDPRRQLLHGAGLRRPPRDREPGDQRDLLHLGLDEPGDAGVARPARPRPAGPERRRRRDADQGHRPIRRWAWLYGIFAVASALQFAFNGTDISADRLAHRTADVRVLRLPPVHDVPERRRSRATTTSRPARSSSSAPPDRALTTNPNGAGIAGPVFVSRIALRLEVEAAHVARPEHRERPPVERGDAADPQALRGGDQQRIRQAGPVLRRLGHQLGGTRRGRPGSAARGGSSPRRATR